MCLTWGLSLFGNPMAIPKDKYSQSNWDSFKNDIGFYPYINEFGFRNIADHVIDPCQDYFDPSLVNPGDSICVGVWLLDWFIAEVHDKIPSPYILITCDLDSWIPKHNAIKLAYDPKVAAWFAKNMIYTNHPKLFQIPMGQIVYLWQHGFVKYINNLDQLVKNRPHGKEYLLYMNHRERNHARRIEIADKFWDKPYCYSRNRTEKDRINMPDFWEEIAKAKFVISPLGLEVDCVRTWECFAIGSIPILEHSYLDPLYKDLPILFVHDWDQINQGFLETKYEELSHKQYRDEKAFMGYWVNLIHEKQEQVRSGNTSFAKIEATNFTSKDLKVLKSILNEFTSKPISLIYKGLLTNLRPYQITKEIKNIQEIKLYDLWENRSYLESFSFDKSLLRTNVINKSPKKNPKHTKKAYFVDLTHFRHALFKDYHLLNDFRHNLEESLLEIYISQRPGEMLFGNMAKDDYVGEVLERLEQKHHIKFKIKDNFWYCISSKT